MQEIVFNLDVEDGWPPVAREGLQCTTQNGYYRVEVPPLFIKNISVGDLIEVQFDSAGDVKHWRQVKESSRSTVWIMTFGGYSVQSVIQKLLLLKCNVERFEEYGYFSIDVPAECPVGKLDACLQDIDTSKASIAFPSFRH